MELLYEIIDQGELILKDGKEKYIQFEFIYASIEELHIKNLRFEVKEILEAIILNLLYNEDGFFSLEISNAEMLHHPIKFRARPIDEFNIDVLFRRLDRMKEIYGYFSLRHIIEIKVKINKYTDIFM